MTEDATATYLYSIDAELYYGDSTCTQSMMSSFMITADVLDVTPDQAFSAESVPYTKDDACVTLTSAAVDAFASDVAYEVEVYDAADEVNTKTAVCSYVVTVENASVDTVYTNTWAFMDNAVNVAASFAAVAMLAYF